MAVNTEPGTFLKKAAKTPVTDEEETRVRVAKLLADIATEGEDGVKRLCREMDKYEGEILLSKEAWDAAIARVPEQTKKDIQIAHANVRSFAEKQLASISEFEEELTPGIFGGQKVVPIKNAGCYVPGGRYAHIASCIMTVTTARVAGVKNVVVASPPRPDGTGVDPCILYTARLCGADAVLCCGGVQAIAALKHGFFTNCPAAIIVGPGNKFVAEAKRTLFGDIGIDMIAGPTEIACIADDSADAEMVATDLVSQAEHGFNSPCWLVTTSERVGKAVVERMPKLIELLPPDARNVSEAAWRDYGEVYLATDREDAVRKMDLYAPEHLEVQCEDLDWWLKNLRDYGSLFLGEETCVTYGDKCSGPNHVLPTKGVAKYSGGLSVHKFVKICTYQRMTKEANKELAVVAARISRAEGMEAHARAGDARLAKYFPEEKAALLKESQAPDERHIQAWSNAKEGDKPEGAFAFSNSPAKRPRLA